MLGLCLFIAFMFLAYNLILSIFENKSTEGLSNEYRNFSQDTFDVLFAGSSVVLNDIHPLQLYHEHGIAAYNLGSGEQTLPLTYYIVKETIREQHPDLYVIDVYTCFNESFTSNDERTHFITDFLRVPEKIEAVLAAVPKEQQLDFLFEFGTYHTRWEELSKTDFERVNPEKTGAYGAKIHYGSKPFESIGTITDAKEQLPELPERYLRKIIELCQKNGTEVLLTLMPANYSFTDPLRDLPKWQKYWNKVQDIADEYGINYLNFMYHYDELKIEDRDFYDNTHLTAYGAEKLTRYLGNYLKSHYELKDVRENPLYDFMSEDFEKFQAYKAELELKSTTSLNDYLDLLETEYISSRYTILMAVKDIQGYAITREITDRLISLGCTGGNILLDRQYHSFISIINGTDVIERYGSDEAICYDGELNDRKLHMSSMTYTKGNQAEIKIGSKDYAKNKRGLNIVLYDNRKEEIIDSVSFDTHVPEFTCSR